LIYINDLPEHILSSVLFIFADDTKCLKTITSFNDSSDLQIDLNLLHEWKTDTNLLFNLAKTFFMSFKPHFSTTYSIGSTNISKVCKHKDLGIVISSDLNWERHYNSVLAKAYKMLGLLRSSFSTKITVQSKKQLYVSLVRSKLSFCLVLLKPYLLKDVKLLEQLQRRATKCILNDYTSDYKHQLKTLKILPLMYFLDISDIMFLIKCLKTPSSAFKIKNY